MPTPLIQSIFNRLFIFSIEHDVVDICLTFHNTSYSPMNIQFGFGIVPFTNEGVGCLKEIQYLSLNRLYQ